jgi:hypothetical protein
MTRSWMRPPIRVGVIAIGIGLGLLSWSGLAVAGGGANPNAGDKVLGTAGGLRYATDSTPGTGVPAAAAAGCGAGKVAVIGGGFTVTGKHVAAATSSPLDAANGWTVTGDANIHTTLTAFSVCGPAAKVDQLSKRIPDQGSRVRHFALQCDQGQDVVGGGVSGENGYNTLGRSIPFDGRDSDSKPNDGWKVGFYDTGGGQDKASIAAICSTGHVSYASKQVAVPVGKSARLTAKCPAGTHVGGGGGGADANPLRDVLTASHPVDGADRDEIPDDGWAASMINSTKQPHKLLVVADCLG